MTKVNLPESEPTGRRLFTLTGWLNMIRKHKNRKPVACTSSLSMAISGT